MPHDDGAGLRLGTNEITRWGAAPADMDALAALIARALNSAPEQVAPEVSAWRRQFTRLHYVR